MRKIGHAGTLDPFADGLLPVCIGRATRVLRFMEPQDKTYRVTVSFGQATDTQDLTGMVIREHILTEQERQQLQETDFSVIRRAVAALTLLTAQMPPMYSAVKVDGRPLYAYARQGLTVERKARPIRIYLAKVEAIKLEPALTADLTIRCSKGTYIRSLCATLGHETGWGAHAAALRRTVCGPWTIEQAVTLDQLTTWLSGVPRAQALQQLTDRQVLLPAAAALSGMPRLLIDPVKARDLVDGKPVELSDSRTMPAGTVAVWSSDQLIAVAVLEQQNEDAWRIRTERVLIDRADLPRSS